MKRLFFFDSVQAAGEYLKRITLNHVVYDSSHDVLIAMNPTVNAYLRKNRLMPDDTLPYFSNESHERLLIISRSLINWLNDNCDLSDPETGIRNAYKDGLVFWMRLTSHYYLRIIEVVANAIERERPEMLCTAGGARRKVMDLFVKPEEGCLDEIVRAAAQAAGLKYECLSKGRAALRKASVDQFVEQSVFVFKTILRLIKFGLWERAVSIRAALDGARPVIFTTRRYQMDRLAADIKGAVGDSRVLFLEGPVPVYFKIPAMAIRIFFGEAGRKILAQSDVLKSLSGRVEANTKLFSHRGINFADILSRKLSDNIINHITWSMLWAYKLAEFLDKLRPRAVVAVGNRFDDGMMAELCKEKGIKTILISHGSIVSPKNEYEAIEWADNGREYLTAPFSIHALQTPLAEGFLDLFPSPAKSVMTGPLIWGKPLEPDADKTVFKKIFKGRYEYGSIKVILHAGTPKRSRLYVYETFDEYIQALRDLAGAVEKVSDAALIIKFRPIGEISLEAIKTLVPFSDKVILSTDESFADLLGITDLLVSFSSTTIEEAIQNRIPVLLYGGSGRYQHMLAQGLISGGSIGPSAVYHVKETQDLEYAINGILHQRLDADEQKDLFEPYIYAGDLKTPFIDLLRSNNLTKTVYK